MNTIKELFTLIHTILKSFTNVADEALAWSGEITAESELARSELRQDREQRIDQKLKELKAEQKAFEKEQKKANKAK